MAGFSRVSRSVKDIETTKKTAKLIRHYNDMPLNELAAPVTNWHRAPYQISSAVMESDNFHEVMVGYISAKAILFHGIKDTFAIFNDFPPERVAEFANNAEVQEMIGKLALRSTYQLSQLLRQQRSQGTTFQVHDGGATLVERSHTAPHTDAGCPYAMTPIFNTFVAKTGDLYEALETRDLPKNDVDMVFQTIKQHIWK